MTTASTEEFSSAFDEAVAAATAELEAAISSDTEPDEPSGEVEAGGEGDQAEVDVDEQAEEPTESVTQPQADEDTEEDLFDDVEVEVAEEQPGIDFESTRFEVAGEEEPVSLQQLVDGYLRQGDYTKKTQEVAAQREENEQAIRLWEVINADPQGFARKIAEDAGLIEAGQGPVADIELSPFRTAEQVNAEIERLVQEKVNSHPSVIEAQKVEIRQRMEGAFSTIEDKYEVKLSPKSRKKILQVASEKGTPDLELVFNALMAQKQGRAAKADGLKAAAPSRSTGRTVETEADEPVSIEEAFALAEVAHGARG